MAAASTSFSRSRSARGGTRSAATAAKTR
jgi:hypothetical protein